MPCGLENVSFKQFKLTKNNGNYKEIQYIEIIRTFFYKTKKGKYYKTDIKHSRKYQLQYFQVQIGIDIVHSIKGWDFYGKVIAID